jgi:hypothetical protein
MGILNKIKFGQLFLLLISFIFLGSGCVMNERENMSDEVIHQEEVVDATKIRGEIIFYTGGAHSEKFKNAKKKKYRPVKVVIVDDSNDDIKKSLSINEFIVDISSSRGGKIISLINKDQPWLWKSAEIDAFADELLLDGYFQGKKWQYKSIYPDKKIENFLGQLWTILQEKK